jgi:LysR family transcriptional regulator for bpeEF and oprC
VTNQIAALEVHFRVKLLHRTTRSMSLTEEGRRCYENAVRMLIDMEELEDALRHSKDTSSGLLRVDVPGIVGDSIVAPALPQFLLDYPDIAVRLTANDRLVDMVEEGIDVMVRIGNLPDTSLVAQTLMKTTYVCCASPAYLARKGVPASPEDLSQFDCLQFILPKSGRMRPWYFQRDEPATSFCVKSGFGTDHVETLVEAAVAGAGIVQVLSMSVQDKIARGELVALLTEHAAPGPDVAVLFQQRHLRAAKVKVFVDFLHHTFRRLQQNPAPVADLRCPFKSRSRP